MESNAQSPKSFSAKHPNWRKDAGSIWGTWGEYSKNILCECYSFFKKKYQTYFDSAEEREEDDNNDKDDGSDDTELAVVFADDGTISHLPSLDDLKLRQVKRNVREILNQKFSTFETCSIILLQQPTYLMVEEFCGDSKASVPWGELAKDQFKYIDPKFIPEGVDLREPTKMQQEELNVLYSHWCELLKEEDFDIKFEDSAADLYKKKKGKKTEDQDEEEIDMDGQGDGDEDGDSDQGVDKDKDEGINKDDDDEGVDKDDDEGVDKDDHELGSQVGDHDDDQNNGDSDLDLENEAGEKDEFREYLEGLKPGSKDFMRLVKLSYSLPVSSILLLYISY